MASSSLYVSSHSPRIFLTNNLIKEVQVGVEQNKIDYGFLYKDNEGDNISLKNPYYCELTTQYWAWKNDITSEFFGFMHYRRLFNLSSNSYALDNWGCVNDAAITDETVNKYGLTNERLDEIFSEYDIVLPELWDVNNAGVKNNYDLYKSGEFLRIKDYDITTSIIEEYYPEYAPYIDAFNKSSHGYYTNMFVMPKAMFFEYSEWLFDVLNKVEGSISIGDYSTQEKRVIGHLSERLINIFIEKKKAEQNLKIYHAQRVFIESIPNSIIIEDQETDYKPYAICFDENYAHSAGALLQSIIDNSSENNKYEINILGDRLSRSSIVNFELIIKNKSNFTLRFIEINQLYNTSEMNVSEHFTPATYARLFLPKLFPNYSKIVYIDADMIVNTDVAKLHEIDIKGNCLGAVKDLVTEGFIRFNHQAPVDFKGHTSFSYLKNYLKMKDPDHYFQAGLLIMSLKDVRESGLDKVMESMIYERKYWYHDQDILNAIFENNVHYLDLSWNVYHGNGSTESFFPNLKMSSYLKFLKSRDEVKIIHYAGDQKPWINPQVDFADYFYRNFMKTPWGANHLFEALNPIKSNLSVLNSKVEHSRTIDVFLVKLKKGMLKAAPNGTKRNAFLRKIRSTVRG